MRAVRDGAARTERDDHRGSVDGHGGAGLIEVAGETNADAVRLAPETGPAAKSIEGRLASRRAVELVS
jgi:hypothetical protein